MPSSNQRDSTNGRLIGAATVVSAQAAIAAYTAWRGDTAPSELVVFSSLLSVIGGIAGNIFASDALDVIRPGTSREWNHDLLRAGALAVSDILKDYCRDLPSEETQIRAIADKVRTFYDEITDENPVSPYTEQELITHIRSGDAFRCPPSKDEEYKKSVEAWTTFLRDDVAKLSRINTAAISDWSRLGEAVAGNFHAQLFEVLKFDFNAQDSELKGRAYAAITLRLLQTTSSAVLNADFTAGLRHEEIKELIASMRPHQHEVQKLIDTIQDSPFAREVLKAFDEQKQLLLETHGYAKVAAEKSTEAAAGIISIAGKIDELIHLRAPIPENRDCPLAPNFCHVYPATAAYTGRSQERSMLTEWFGTHEATPVLVLEAMGGMGKSALAWQWVNEDLLRNNSMQDGLIWWSFYESNATFESFVHRALAYFAGKDFEPDLSLGRPGWHLASFMRQRSCLVVLDGVERELREYEGMGASYQGDMVDDTKGNFRDCVSPDFEEFLSNMLLPAPSNRAKLLLTTRLTPQVLDNRQGHTRHNLLPMTRADALLYFRARGITEDKATRAEIEWTCDRYGYLPLALTLLIGLVLKDPKFMGDIRAAQSANIKLVPTEPGRLHETLDLAYSTMRSDLKHFLCQLSAFRFGFDYEALESIFISSVPQLSTVIQELEERGFLMRDSQRRRFDLHPVVRQYAYDRLASKQECHARLCDYFSKVPTANTSRTLEGLAPVIEMFHHTVRTGQIQKAIALYQDRLWKNIYFRMGAYQVEIESLTSIIVGCEVSESASSSAPNLGWVFHQLGYSHLLSGQPRKAAESFLRGWKLAASSDSGFDDPNRNIATSRYALAMAQMMLGELSEAESNLRASIEWAHQNIWRRLKRPRPPITEILKNNDKIPHDYVAWYWGLAEIISSAASFHRDLGWLLLVCGRSEEGEEELDIAREAFKSLEAGQSFETKQSQGIVCLISSMAALSRGRVEPALEAAREARHLADVQKLERDIVRADCALGVAERITGNLLLAEQNLVDALIRCRRINLVECEGQILLEKARLLRQQNRQVQALVVAKEAMSIADRSEYRLQQADVHNFLAEHYRDEAQSTTDSALTALARDHANRGALFASCDGVLHRYKFAWDEAQKLLASMPGA